MVCVEGHLHHKITYFSRITILVYSTNDNAVIDLSGRLTRFSTSDRLKWNGFQVCFL